MIILDKDSVNKILKNSNEVMVFGMNDCQYGELAQALAVLKLEVSMAVGHQLEELNYSSSKNPGGGIMGALCKNLLSSLILENYKRVQENKSIIPLIFCVGFESDTKKTELKVKYIAEEHYFWGSITNKELRRCYKLYAETDSNIKQIAAQTFKFIKLKQGSINLDNYFLEEVPPFWEDNTFKEAWKIRISDPNRKSQIIAKNNPKKYQWKNELKSAIGLFDKSRINNNNNNKAHDPIEFQDHITPSANEQSKVDNIQFSPM